MQPNHSPEFLASQHLSPTFPERFWAKVDKNGPIPDQIKYPGLDQCWVWTASKDEFGYGRIGVGGHAGPMIRAHVASWILHFGPVPKGQCVCHKCDNPGCPYWNHLFLGTREDNLADMRNKGRGANGDSHGRRILTSEQAAEIRRRYVRGSRWGMKANTKALSEEFGVCTGTIWCIARGDIWSSV